MPAPAPYDLDLDPGADLDLDLPEVWGHGSFPASDPPANW
jgi:hypothetical protein